MGMTRLISRVMNTMVNSISGQNRLTKSISSNANVNANASAILFKRRVTKDCGSIEENILSFLKYPIPNTNTDVDALVENIDLPYFKDSLNLVISGYSHGIVCLNSLNNDICLCNPYTREFRLLPPSILMTTRDAYQDSVGFGYDPKSNDFKVVRVVVFHEEDCYKTEVFNMSKGEWREIITPVPTPGYATSTSEMFHNGIYYWWSCGCCEEASKTIRTFDISREVFGTLPVPESCVNVYDDYDDDVDDDDDHDEDWNVLRMMVWNGSIVLLHYPYNGDEKSFDIWAIDDESNGGVSWSKVLTIGPLSRVMRPLLFVNSDELIMEAKDGQVISYNLITKEIKNLPLKGIPDRFDGYLFQKSLLSVVKT